MIALGLVMAGWSPTFISQGESGHLVASVEFTAKTMPFFSLEMTIQK
jgi:hypothetical protein